VRAHELEGAELRREAVRIESARRRERGLPTPDLIQKSCYVRHQPLASNVAGALKDALRASASRFNSSVRLRNRLLAVCFALPQVNEA
jgi:hypothetical protein